MGCCPSILIAILIILNVILNVFLNNDHWVALLFSSKPTSQKDEEVLIVILNAFLNVNLIVIMIPSVLYYTLVSSRESER